MHIKYISEFMKKNQFLLIIFISIYNLIIISTKILKKTNI